MNLNKFAQSTNLHATSLDFFVNDLNIKISPFDSKPIAVADFFKDESKIKTVAVQNIDKLFVIGLVDDNTLNNQQSQLQTVKDASTITQDYQGLMLCAIQLKTTPARTQLAELTRLVNRAFPYLPVTIIFKYDDKITFTNAERAKYVQAWREGEKIGKISMLKDIDLHNTHGAHLKILNDLRVSNTVETFNALYQYWQKILNTKELNKKFFKKIANWYFWSVAKSKFPYDYLKKDEKHTGKTNAELQNLANQKATIRFITRMIFVWFLKEKKLIPSNLFDVNYIKTIVKDFDKKNNRNYYNAILQNLFFATLNRIENTRDFATDNGFHKNKQHFDVNSLYRYEKMFCNENPDSIMNLFTTIPFLNGGLFDSLDNKDSNEIIDGFSRKKDWQATMPNELFFENTNVDFDAELRTIYDTKKGNYEVKGLFAIFEEYKFTVEENTPLEVDVALDPYLLGEIFENLLAYYNPETGATARKGSGSFYTPQEIVNYMVDESLLAYLKPVTDSFVKVSNFDKATLVANVDKATQDETFSFNNLQNLTENQKLQLVEALANVKILDPACGSGAFPMGVLYKMVDILKTIDPQNILWKQVQHDKKIGERIIKLKNDDKLIDTFSDDELRIKAKKTLEYELQELENNFNNKYHFDDYTRKLYIIQNSIYGVDIQDVAIQISKLRFFLSLIIDQKNEAIQPLPNLETKFVIANTLIGIELPKFTVMGEEDHSQDQVKHLKEELKTIREKHFYVTDRKEKLALKKQDQAKRQEIANAIADSINVYKQEDIDKLNAELETQKRNLAEADVIPDMVQEIIVKDLFGGESTSKVNYRKERIKECNAQIRLIESKKTSLQTNTQAEIIRQQAQKIADWDIYNQNAQAEWFDSDWMFGISDGFDIVIGNPPYVQSKFMDSITKNDLIKNYKTCRNQFDIFNSFIEICNKILKKNAVCSYIIPDRFLVNKDYFELRNFILSNFEINEIITLGDGVFDSVNMPTAIISLQNIQNVSYNFNVKKNIDDKGFDVRTENIKTDSDLKIPVFAENSETILLQKIDKQSEKVKDYFNDIRGVEIGKDSELIVNVSDKNTVPFLIGGDVGRYSINQNKHLNISYKNIKYKSKEWYSGNKLIFRKTGLGINATFDNSGVYVIQVIYIIKLKPTFVNLINEKFILALINSKLNLFWYFKNYGQEDRKTFPHITQGKIKDLPVKQISLQSQQPFITLVDKILDGKKQGHNTTTLEHEIDVMVYHLYGLRYSEACVIDAGLLESDYKKYKIE